MNDITCILRAIEQGESHVADHLWPLVYEELRQLAGIHMARERPGHTLDATALVHEAYLRLGVDRDHAFANRRHFFAAAAGWDDAGHWKEDADLAPLRDRDDFQKLLAGLEMKSPPKKEPAAAEKK